MPIFFEQEVDKDTRLAVWHIAEEEAFFDVPLQRAITHPHKRLQHLAGRYLLRHLFPDFPLALIRIADTRKPFLDDEAFHFSVSHCGDYAAAIASRSLRVGIDIELVSEKVQRIRHKFLSPVEEQRIAPGAACWSDPELATLVWSSKEAVFKWYGKGNVDFRHDMPVQSVRDTEAGCRFSLLFGKELGQPLDVHCRMTGDLCLAYVAG
ncbi:4'-phosphopantetheinyl transferase superfamily protein [Flaviaesturariibacter flavus]|uniref:4'-phosphopantetheinyl transferase superfamily protein n=1 Tax=Flaviaesturariibacter flavus TaxID=2502780 RepID=A0A4R1BP98_9BACT|nr:4'-phosphopantetheinyl transferase superfamily protein [Flaviaesturariibacter flavus]TCJ19351.1 4'-phosphopantetheinyl transferase superfamily protein [Flaviaesturariibacter flavus]